MRFTPKIQAMIDAAKAEGFELRTVNASAGVYRLGKIDRRNNSFSKGIQFSVSETGAFYQAHRIDVRLDQATTIRSVEGARECLYLKADKLTPAQRATILHLDECKDNGWASSVGFALTRAPTCRVLYRLGLIDWGETQGSSEIRHGPFGRGWHTVNVANTPIKLTSKGRDLAKRLKGDQQ